MNPMLRLPVVALSLFSALAAQSPAIFPAEYANVPEGPFNSPNLPLANGTSRVMIAYDRIDLPVPTGRTITRLGFRQDGTLTTTDTGRALQLEIRMGYTGTSSTLVSTFADNYAAAPTTVFGPALFQLPALRAAQNPLPSGIVWIDLTTPFVYAPGNGHLVVEYRVHGNSAGGAAFNYRLDRADFWSPVAQGVAGCAHSGGRTAVLTMDPCRVGGSFSASVATGPQNTFSVLVLSTSGPLVTPFSLQPFVPGVDAACRSQVPLGSVLTLGALTGSTGNASYAFTIPNNPVYNDLILAGQAAFFDFFAPGGLAVSNAAQVQVGIRPRTSLLSAQGPPLVVTTGAVQAGYAPVSLFAFQ